MKRSEIYLELSNKYRGKTDEEVVRRDKGAKGVCIVLGNRMGGYLIIPDYKIREAFPEFFRQEPIDSDFFPVWWGEDDFESRADALYQAYLDATSTGN